MLAPENLAQLSDERDAVALHGHQIREDLLLDPQQSLHIFHLTFQAANLLFAENPQQALMLGEFEMECFDELGDQVV